MRKQAYKPRLAWEDRFRTPDAAALMSHYNKQTCGLFCHVRERLLALPDVTECVQWRGVPWRWTLAYLITGDASRELAFLVANPEKPLLSVPLDPESLAALNPKKLSKAARDAISAAPQVGSVLWPVWALQSKTQVHELMQIVDVRRELATATA